MELNWKEHIESNPKVMFGKPVIKGTRIPVDLILEKLSLGENIDQLLKSYPSIKIESIYACLKFASESVKNEVVTA
ncbi:MAG TPA: DUF433 domain-containing protein [Ignavibacteria bacterium]|nr:antitoxin [Bacteroidota bacterium]HRE10874.1 DUF433 domain-containing protein [Ignavibacteria bacterium]HRF66110.1 DUF433 domain-containing protein [Ignavibacteria bacterium]HRJ03514.1 DUF433 domain-containing protein [Ignavibacteria bacterium]HRJ84098.1 DUF433 domain-containing protein [Ignavibacteria bacterium]